jgi:hypothetical protein
MYILNTKDKNKQLLDFQAAQSLEFYLVIRSILFYVSIKNWVTSKERLFITSFMIAIVTSRTVLDMQ